MFPIIVRRYVMKPSCMSARHHSTPVHCRRAKVSRRCNNALHHRGDLINPPGTLVGDVYKATTPPKVLCCSFVARRRVQDKLANAPPGPPTAAPTTGVPCSKFSSCSSLGSFRTRGAQCNTAKHCGCYWDSGMNDGSVPGPRVPVLTSPPCSSCPAKTIDQTITKKENTGALPVGLIPKTATHRSASRPRLKIRLLADPGTPGTVAGMHKRRITRQSGFF